MPVLTGEPRSRVHVAGTVALIAAVMAVGCFGCGSGDGDSSTETGARTVTESGEDAPKAVVGNSKGSADRQPTQAGSSGSVSKHKHSHSETDQKPNRAAPSTSKGEQTTSKGKQTAAADEPKASCPTTLTRAQCAAVVRATTEGAPSNVLDEPRDCLKIMGRAECEALAAKLRDVFKHSNTFSFDECLQNPTPKCEEVFGPVLEQQRAASQGSEN